MTCSSWIKVNLGPSRCWVSFDHHRFRLCKSSPNASYSAATVPRLCYLLLIPCCLSVFWCHLKRTIVISPLSLSLFMRSQFPMMMISQMLGNKRVGSNQMVGGLKGYFQTKHLHVVNGYYKIRICSGRRLSTTTRGSRYITTMGGLCYIHYISCAIFDSNRHCAIPEEAWLLASNWFNHPRCLPDTHASIDGKSPS